RTEAGYDAMMQAEGGLMSITGDADGPPFRLGIAIADIATGLFAAQGILAALYARERTGRGQCVDVAMLDSVAALLTYQAAIAFATGATPARMGNRHPSIAPYDTFTASDGDFVLSVGNDDQFGRLRVLGNPVKMSDTPPAIRSAPPTLGQHTRSILRTDLGLSGEHVRALVEARAVGV